MKEGDFTERLTTKSQDEIGEVMRLLNLTQEGVGSLIISIKEKAETLLKIGKDLASDMQTTANAISQITSNINSVKEKVTIQSGSVIEAKSTMEKVSAAVDRQNTTVEAQTKSVSQSSSAIEEMLANIQSVTKTLIRNAESVEELIKVSDEGRSSMQKVSNDIQEIAKESEGLLAINSVMENIASQTNLLSMNAAIEAAHAGESGKGFAVVAGEIRKLATSSTAQSKTIAEVLKKIKTAIDKITVSTNMVVEKFHAIEEHISTVAEHETSIRNAMEEQGQGSQQILEAIASLNNLTGLVKKGSQDMLLGSKEVIMENANLEKTTREISGGMNNMAGEAGEINAAVNHVNEISKSNKDNISRLFAEVSKFKVN
jgi:methyl-accepting chemotaxis protein